MLPTSARLLELLTLLQARRCWKGAALAQRLAVTERTVRRDVDRLRSLGYPVHAASGVNGGYRLAAGAALPPLLLTDDEAVAVAIGLRTAAGGGVAGIEETVLRALVKLEQLLPRRLRHRLGALHASIVPLDPHGPTVDADVLATLAGACREHEQLRFGYEDRRAQSSRRHVEPQGLVHASGRWLVRGTFWTMLRVIVAPERAHKTFERSVIAYEHDLREGLDYSLSLADFSQKTMAAFWRQPTLGVLMAAFTAWCTIWPADGRPKRERSPPSSSSASGVTWWSRWVLRFIVWPSCSIPLTSKV